MNPANPPDLNDTEPDLRLSSDDVSAHRGAAGGRPSSGGWLIAIGLLLLIGGIGWYFWSTTFAPKPAPVAAVAPPPAAPTEPPKEEPRDTAPQFPIETTSPAEPLPVLAESDKALGEGLAGAIDRDAIARYLISQDFIRRVVATVDNLPRKTYAQRLSPLKPVPGKFEVGTRDGHLAISAQNAARYTPLVRALEAVNSEKLVALYVRFYPLFQEAYRELGYPKGHFNDRLVHSLDLLIATREQPGQLAVVQPKVFYEYADPALEALPSGQKILLRMGPDNAARTKAKLKEIRALVAKEGAAAKEAAK